jgi:hypothetical protein
MKKSLLIVCCLFLIVSCKKEESKEMDVAVMADDTIVKPAEFADFKYAEIGKKSLMAMEKGDMDGWIEIYADNAVYVWNNGDSLVGKPAIASYWKQRRANVIETIKFSDAIWLPIMVNTPQSVEAKGVWLLGWYKTTAKYRNGKEMTQWIHTDYHFDSNDKVDRVIQYIDRAAIATAMKK